MRQLSYIIDRSFYRLTVIEYINKIKVWYQQAMSERKIKIREKTEDMRLKKCNLCHKIKKIHKYDCFCDSCKGAANNIRRNNEGIFK